MSTLQAPARLHELLGELFTRTYYSAAGYVFESQPFGVADDDKVLNALRDLRRQERGHARMIARVLESLERVPEAGVFPYWHRDLNYLSVAYMSGFVCEALGTDIERLDEAIAIVPKYMGLARRMLESIRTEKAEALSDLEELSKDAKEREAARYVQGRKDLQKRRADRIAKEKAELEAKRKGGSAGGAFAHMPDPDEPGISNKERAKRYVLRMRAMKAGGGAAPGAAAVDPFHDLPDPNEPGISNKEKAKRTMLRKRRQKDVDSGKWQPPAGAGGAADPFADLPDPNEPGISNKEKAQAHDAAQAPSEGRRLGQVAAAGRSRRSRRSLRGPRRSGRAGHLQQGEGQAHDAAQAPPEGRRLRQVAAAGWRACRRGRSLRRSARPGRGRDLQQGEGQAHDAAQAPREGTEREEGRRR